MLPEFVQLSGPQLQAGAVNDNRRAHPRVDTCLGAVCHAMAAGKNVRVTDLSEGGCYVDSIAAVVVGEVLSLKILSGANTSLQLSAVVAHHCRLGFGVQFINLNDSQLEQLRSLIEKQPR
ncbi:MAG TPA: PilZ domain-containing protein [Pyrinomonadaceae bacterium]|nr:PilZ domain-containing protein [Pyrinomonadaceae bacterium]